ncbi:hypothetical protein ACQKWADRAFT_299222 [Trichoderma austrokoningii]
MCTTNVYTYVYPDGHEKKSHKDVLCSASRNGKVCSQNVIFEHSSQPIRHPDSALGTSPGSIYLSQFPPTPTYSPRSGTPIYRSGDESERSRRSSSSSSRRRRSSSIYVNGPNVIELGRRERSPRRERIVLVESPPTPRTPPTSFLGEFTRAPSRSNSRSRSHSPNASASPSVFGSPLRSNSNFFGRPIIVDDRGRVERVERAEPPRFDVKIVEAVPPSRRAPRIERRSSISSRGSLERSSDREVALADEEEERQRSMRLRIARANAEINKRPPVPMPIAPLRASSFKRSYTIDDSAAQRLTDDIRRLSFAEDQDEAAQRRRLANRMSMPPRRITTGDNRRHTVFYDDHSFSHFD